MTNRYFLLFFIFATLYTVSTFFGDYPFNWALKVIPMLVLIFIAFKQLKTKAQHLFLIGLGFSTVGDFILTYYQDSGFIFGLAAFLFAHLFYLSSLYPIEKKNLVPVAVYVVYGAAMLQLIVPGLAALLIPVLIYMSVLLLMGIFTLSSTKSNIWLIVGGISFVISDSLLGLNKFHAPIANSHTLIMVSYYFAQFSLLKGMFFSTDQDIK